MPVRTDNDISGAALAEDLLQGVGNEQMRAATRLLGAHRNGYWLRRFIGDQELAAATADHPLIDRDARRPSVDWDAVGLVLLDKPWILKASSSEKAVLEIAASLLNRCGVQLGRVLRAVDGREFRLILDALAEAGHSPA
ncbi:hypothetical protein ACIOJE_38055 [Kitasatospora sp. NPDC087861]|uniref:hypothetical protein n=1 Tax=unclassified Kitasatospora TaxID=2633591 RepID=UPI002475E32D|nr:hypothetical protein [Kitasatospora sp. MAA19]